MKKDERDVFVSDTPTIKATNRPLLVRLVCLLLVFALAAVGLGYRLSVLQIDEAASWEARASQQQLKKIPIEAERGVIYDAQMKPLAQSNTVWSVTASPDVMAANGVNGNKEADAAALAAKQLAEMLELDEAELYEKLGDAKKKYYMVKAKIEKPVADEVRAFCTDNKVSGIYLIQDTKRYYPYEELAATVLGFTNADGDGIEGVESRYNSILAGTAGRSVSVVNAFGNEMPVDDAMTYPAEDGGSLVLTLDVEIQKSLEKHLAAVVNKYSVKQRAMGIVMEVKTGAILAISTTPSYNPNNPYEIYDAQKREEIEAMPEGTKEEKAAKSQAQSDALAAQWRNKALADTYEPGSVFKVITAAAALDSGKYSAGSTFHCSSKITVADTEFSCAQGTAHGTVDLPHALIESCNCSFVQMGAGLGSNLWYDYLNAFGLTEPTGVDLPGEPSQRAIQNLVYSAEGLGPVQLASCSFGQSNKYTAMQMITAVSAAVNGGNLMQPHIVSKVLDAKGNVTQNYEPTTKRQVVSAATSEQLRGAMEELVAETGNGRNAYIAGFRVGGKSGTSEKVEKFNAEGGAMQYISSFVGFAPANDPDIAVLVALDEPEDHEMGNYFGGRLVGPTIREVIRDCMPLRGISASYESEEELARTTVDVPAVAGSDLNAAQKTINNQALDYQVVGNGSKVVAQFPEAHSRVPYGGTVFLYTEEGEPQTLTVPDLRDKTPAAAIQQCKSLGLNVVTTGAPNSGSGVLVSEQSIEPGQKVQKGTVITLTMMDKSAVGDL